MAKYTKGRRLSPGQAFAAVAAGRPIYDDHKVQTPGWTRSWQVNYLISAARQGRIFSARIKEKGSAKS